MITTNNRFMKKILLFAAAALALFSCQEKTEEIEKNFYWKASTEETIVGEKVTFTDYSVNVESREWGFPDGSPSSSNDASVDVIFNTPGNKEVSLTVKYADGSEDKSSITVKVKDPMSAQIAVNGLTPKGCAKIGQSIKFSLDDIKGNPTKFEWTFPGGTPETSTEESPSVVWNRQIDNVEVKCVISRESDGASVTLTKNIIAGNYPLFVKDTKYNMDVFGFEAGETNNTWYSWGKFPEDNTADNHPEILTIVEGGANNTAHCMKIDISKTVAGDCMWEISHRDNWVNNPRLEVGKKYELSLWCRADNAETNIAGCFWIQLYNWIPEWLYDKSRDLLASATWSEIFPGETFAPEGAQVKIWEGAISAMPGEEGGQFTGLLESGWKQYKFEINLDIADKKPGDILKNCFFGFGITGNGATVYIDELRLDLIEE